MQFPTTQDITHIVRNRVTDPATFRARSFCPITPEYVAEIQYDILAPSFGMTAAHNLNADPVTTQVPVMGTAKFGTAYWKETLTIKEDELLKARAAGSYNQRAGRDLVAQRAIHLDTRLETRLEWLPWQVITTGNITVNENNVSLSLDYGLKPGNKPDISADAARNWKNGTNADPADDINSWVLQYRGTGARAKKVFFNQETARRIIKNPTIQNMLKNTNYVVNLTVANAPAALKLLIPTLDFEIYDGGYLDESKNFQLFIPDGRFVMLGEGMPGEKMMDFVSTLSLHNGGIEKPQPGKFAIVEDLRQAKKNPKIDMTVGIYGLPRLFHPEWIISAKVF